MTATNICYNFVGFRCSPPIPSPFVARQTGEFYLHGIVKASKSGRMQCVSLGEIDGDFPIIAP